MTNFHGQIPGVKTTMHEYPTVRWIKRSAQTVAIDASVQHLLLDGEGIIPIYIGLR